MGAAARRPRPRSSRSPVAERHVRPARRSTRDAGRRNRAEALGEFDEALSAYQAAARRALSTRTWLRLGEMADRMGQGELAIQSLEQAYGRWREHASLGLKVGVVMKGFANCRSR